VRLFDWKCGEVCEEDMKKMAGKVDKLRD